MSELQTTIVGSECSNPRVGVLQSERSGEDQPRLTASPFFTELTIVGWILAIRSQAQRVWVSAFDILGPCGVGFCIVR